VNVTNDIAIGLRTNLVAAEQLKVRFGSAADGKTVPAGSAVPGGAGSAVDPAIEIIDDGVARPAHKSDVTEIIDARMRELFEKIGDEISGHASAHRLPAGLVLTGGGALLADTAELGRDVLEMPVRVAAPQGVGGLTDHLLTPSYSTAIGLLLWAARVVQEQDLERYEPPPSNPGWNRIQEVVRRFFP
jgi:cell division protein FtsA